MIFKKDVLLALKVIRGEVRPMPDLIKQLIKSLLVYKSLGEFDGSLDSAIVCLRQAEYEIEE